MLLAKAWLPGLMVIRFCFWLARMAPVNIMSQPVVFLVTSPERLFSLARTQNRATTSRVSKLHKKDTQIQRG